ncbi:MAG: hypothetical protein M3083_00635 [Actinomycetota bacterium]|nr:hypothetical protein [Actinomycetota bacterium]MDQ6945090.1 hypothetical protein [Actinomycetota bacterium]
MADPVVARAPDDEERLTRIEAAKVRLGAHLEAAERAAADGTLGDIIRDTPSVEEQFRQFVRRRDQS